MIKNTVYKTPTKDKYFEVLQELENQSCKWVYNQRLKPTGLDIWETFKSDTILIVRENQIYYDTVENIEEWG